MIFRLSQKLNAKINTGTLAAQPLSEDSFWDWSASLFVADRTQYILVTNTKSFYSTVMFAKGIVDAGRFISRALDNIREFMEDDGQAFAFHSFIVPGTGSVRFAKALDRSVTGAMNELIFQAKGWLTAGDLSPHEVGFRLNDVLLSTLAKNGSAYGRPREAFKSLMSDKGSARLLGFDSDPNEMPTT